MKTRSGFVSNSSSSSFCIFGKMYWKEEFEELIKKNFSEEDYLNAKNDGFFTIIESKEWKNKFPSLTVEGDPESGLYYVGYIPELTTALKAIIHNDLEKLDDKVKVEQIKKHEGEIRC